MPFYGQTIMRKIHMGDQVMSKASLTLLTQRAATVSAPAANPADDDSGIEPGTRVVKGCVLYPGETQQEYGKGPATPKRSYIFD